MHCHEHKLGVDPSMKNHHGALFGICAVSYEMAVLRQAHECYRDQLNQGVFRAIEIHHVELAHANRWLESRVFQKDQFSTSI